MCTATATGLHPFEQAGLGKAPFRFVGLSEKVYQACPGAPEQPAGSCDYCGTGIRYCCHIQSSDGREFVVGTDCVMKLEREDNRLVSAVEAAKRAHDRKMRHAKNEAKKVPERERIAKAFAMLDDAGNRAHLASLPHPSFPYDTRCSLMSYVEWMQKMAGHSGKLRVAKLIEKALA